MYLLYVDESGHFDDPNLNHFILSGFSIFERQTWWISNQLDKIAERFNKAEPENIELHANLMLQGRKEWRAFPKQKRINALYDSLELFNNSHQSSKIFACVIDKSKISESVSIFNAFEQILSRFDYNLTRHHEKGDTQRGIVIFDKTSYESSFQNLAREFRKEGHSFGKIRNFSEVPLFIDSRASRLTQLADIIAYSIFRNFERNDSRFFDIIKNRFDSCDGIKHGLKIIS